MTRLTTIMTSPARPRCRHPWIALGGGLFMSLLGGVHASERLPWPVDPAFTNGLPAVKAAAGFIETGARAAQFRWQPNLQVLVGVKALEGSKQTVRFVELTTLRPPPTDSTGQPWTAPLRTNGWSWAGTNSPAATNQSAEYISPIYPVRVRVYDESGDVLKQGTAALPWGLTNGLLDICRISAQLNRAWDNANGAQQTNASLAVTKKLHLLKRSQRKASSQPATIKATGADAESAATAPADPADPEDESAPPKYTENNELMRAVGGGFLWMITMFDELRTVPAVRGIWEKVRYAVRLPTLRTVATSLLKGRFELSLHPRFAEVELMDPATDHSTDRFYRLPVDMNFGDQHLARLDMIVGRPEGAEVLLAGIKSIRATHPDRPQQELMAQVLAIGRAAEDR